MFALQLQSFSRSEQQFKLLPDCDPEVVSEMVNFLEPVNVSSDNGKCVVTFQSENSPENVNQDIISHFRATSHEGVWFKPVQLQYTSEKEEQAGEESPAIPSSSPTSLTPTSPTPETPLVRSLSAQNPNWLVFQTGHTRRLAIQRIFARLRDAVEQRKYGIRASIQAACIWDREENRVLSPTMTDSQFFKLKETLSRDGVIVFSGASVRDVTGLLRILRDVRFAHNCYLENLVEIGISETPVGTVCLFQIPTQ